MGFFQKMLSSWITNCTWSFRCSAIGPYSWPAFKWHICFQLGPLHPVSGRIHILHCRIRHISCIHTISSPCLLNSHASNMRSSQRQEEKNLELPSSALLKSYTRLGLFKWEEGNLKWALLKASIAVLFLSSVVCSTHIRQMFLGEHLEGPWKRKRVLDHEKMGKKGYLFLFLNCWIILRMIATFRKKMFCIGIKP